MKVRELIAILSRLDQEKGISLLVHDSEQPTEVYDMDVIPLNEYEYCEGIWRSDKEHEHDDIYVVKEVIT